MLRSFPFASRGAIRVVINIMSVHREGVEPNSVDGPDHHDHIEYVLQMNHDIFVWHHVIFVTDMTSVPVCAIVWLEESESSDWFRSAAEADNKLWSIFDLGTQLFQLSLYEKSWKKYYLGKPSTTTNKVRIWNLFRNMHHNEIHYTHQSFISNNFMEFV